jgi:1-acyl-sn-glycerol-3-phosphate acyltransferase
MYEANTKTAARALGFLNPRRLYHRAEIDFAERLPASGGAVIVSNHGRLDFDCFILVNLMLRSRGRLVHLLADHLWFKVPGMRRVMALAGAVDGTRENAVRLLERGELILAYPGGVREIMDSRFGRERIDWQGRTGFAKIALSAGVPVIPVVGVGVNSGFLFVSSGRLLGRLLFQLILRLGPAYKDYRNPLALGILPLPLPLSIAVNFPLPCKLRYLVGEPIQPPVGAADPPVAGGPERAGEPRSARAEEDELAARVAESMRRMIEHYGRP